MSNTQLEWKRGKRDQTQISNRIRWESRCGQYEVIEAVSHLPDMPTIYYAIHLPATLLKRGKTRQAAERACEKHLNPSKKRKKKKS